MNVRKPIPNKNHKMQDYAAVGGVYRENFGRTKHRRGQWYTWVAPNNFKRSPTKVRALWKQSRCGASRYELGVTL